MKRPRVTVKRGETEVTITSEDVYAWVMGGVALIAAITFSILLIRGMLNEANVAFAFLTGMGVTEGLRQVIHKNITKQRKRRK